MKSTGLAKHANATTYFNKKTKSNGEKT